MTEQRELRSERFLLREIDHPELWYCRILYNGVAAGAFYKDGHVDFDCAIADTNDFRELADLIDRWNAGEDES